MKIPQLILTGLVLASLNGVAQNEKPIGCGKMPEKEIPKKPSQVSATKNDSIKKAQIKEPKWQCGKCGRG